MLIYKFRESLRKAKLKASDLNYGRRFKVQQRPTFKKIFQGNMRNYKTANLTSVGGKSH